MLTIASGYPAGAAWLAIAATVVSALALVALHRLSPEFQPSWRMVSEYANGQHGWALAVVFFGWALGSLALAWALMPLGAGWIGAAGLLVLVLAAIGQAMGGIFDVNHRLHGLAFAIGVPALPVAAVLLTLAGRRAGLDLPVWPALLPILSLVAMAVSMALLFSALQARGITMSADTGPLPALPDGVTAWNGWANRLVFAAYYVWVIMAARAALLAAPG